MQMLAEEYPVTQICEVWGSTRSSYYRRKGPTDEIALQEAIEKLAGQWPTYGYRRITQQLRREGWTVNHKRVERLMRAAGLHIHRKAKRRTTTDSSHPFPRYPNLVEHLEIVRPEQVWVSDITYIRLREEFVYLAVIMDVFTRCIRGWHLGRSLDQRLTLQALDHALIQHTPEIHHSEEAGAVCSYGLYRTVANSRGADQHGRGGSSVAKWLRGATDAHDQRRGG